MTMDQSDIPDGTGRPKPIVPGQIESQSLGWGGRRGRADVLDSEIPSRCGAGEGLNGGPLARRSADRPTGAIDREVRRRIGRNLRLLYAEVLTQPLPDRFEALLAELSSRTVSRETS